MNARYDPAALTRIAEKLTVLRRLADEDGSGVVIGPPEPLEPLPDLPGVAEVYSLFDRLEGNNFRFLPPPQTRTPAAWAAHLVNPDDPMGSPLVVGKEIRSVPAGLRDAIAGGDPIYLDLEDLDVYWMEPDDYVWQYKHPDDDVPFTVIAPDLATFFDRYVLGPGYPELVAIVLGDVARDERLRRGRHAGRYADSWRRLLITAGLSD
ncbi:hypothetical protein ACFOW4_17360 [Micromonospora sp. GCM10011542]|uniref:hypothetical protein n=1 Tax=Micromonospora sp. GCM10011542 TaxID=3317337 RepID=UPI0036157C6A